jgi:hypothetical protein
MFKHLTDVNKTYFQHLAFAFKSGILALGAGVALIIHGFIPSLFTVTGSTIVRSLNTRFDSVKHKHK